MEYHVRVVADAVEKSDITTLRGYAEEDLPYHGLVQRYLDSSS